MTLAPAHSSAHVPAPRGEAHLRLAAAPDAGAGRPATPYLALDLATAVRRFRMLARTLPGTAVHYAVKANPHPALLAALAGAGCRFDVASPTEVRASLRAGAVAGELVDSNPVKRREDIEEAAALGVRLFVVDSLEETRKVAEAAPGSEVLCRIVTSGEGSDGPLSRKYGCSAPQAVEILAEADRLGLAAAGISFHVGSQQRDPGAWASPVAAAARVFTALGERGIRPWLLDLGGGFPAHLEDGAPPLAAYGASVELALRRAFDDAGPPRPRTLVEPGRSIVGDAGAVVASVVAVLHRGDTRWVYLDAGVFTGMVETLDEAIRYRLATSSDGGPTGPCVLAGPTCDSADVLYEKRMVPLPLALAEGDRVVLRSAGAYSTCYSTVGFNGFDPMPTVLVTR
jgi:ornithine decarboxylase